MLTLDQRLRKTLEHGKLQRTELMGLCHVSAAAVSKWFSGRTKVLKAEHVLTIARRCRVDPSWLGSGEGPAPGEKPRANQVEEARAIYKEFEPRHIDLLRMYKRLPKEVRAPIRALIETLAATHSERYAAWSRRTAEAYLEREK